MRIPEWTFCQHTDSSLTLLPIVDFISTYHPQVISQQTSTQFVAKRLLVGGNTTTIPSSITSAFHCVVSVTRVILTPVHVIHHPIHSTFCDKVNGCYSILNNTLHILFTPSSPINAAWWDGVNNTFLLHRTLREWMEIHNSRFLSEFFYSTL